MVKYLCGILIFLSITIAQVGKLDLDIIEIKDERFLNLVDSLISVEKNCDYYKENGYFTLDFRYDSLIGFTFVETEQVYTKYKLEHKALILNEEIVICSFKENDLPDFVCTKNETVKISVYYLDTLKPELMTFGANISERYFTYEDGKYEMKYDLNRCK